MRILLDMDGPLAGFDAACWELVRDYDVPTIDADGEHNQTARYMTDHIAPTRRTWFRKQLEQPGWFESLPVTPGAVDGVAALEELGVDLWVVTKPMEKNPTCRDAKAMWLRTNGFESLEDKLIIAPDKSLVVGDILLDDAPAVKWFAAAAWRPVIFTAGFNGPESEWTGSPRWDWSKPIDELLWYATAATRGEQLWG